MKRLWPLLTIPLLFEACSPSVNVTRTQVPADSLETRIEVVKSDSLSLPKIDSLKTPKSSEISIKENKNDIYLRAKDLSEQAYTQFQLGNDSLATKLYQESMSLFIKSGLSADEWTFFDPASQMDRLDQYRKLQFEISNGIIVSQEEIDSARASLKEHSHFEFGDKFAGKVAEYKIKFQGEYKDWFEETMSRSFQLFPFIDSLLVDRSVSPFITFMYPVESALKFVIGSRAGAKGIAQFMKYTARLYGLKVDYGYWYDERFDPVKALNASADMMANLYDIFVDPYLSVAAYNAGVGRVLRNMNTVKASDFDELLETGILPNETERHIPQIYAFMELAENYKKYGFDITPAFNSALEKILTNNFDLVVVDRQTDFDLVADILKMDVDSLKALNPAYRMWGTPPEHLVPKGEAYAFEIRVPKGSGDSLMVKLSDIDNPILNTRFQYTVRRGETLSSIGHRFGVSYHEIMRANNIRSAKNLRIGQNLIILGVKRTSNNRLEEIVSVVKPRTEDPDKFDVYSYKIKSGDNLSDIAIKINEKYEPKKSISVNDLRAWNSQYSKTNLIRAGDELKFYVPKNLSIPDSSRTFIPDSLKN